MKKRKIEACGNASTQKTMARFILDPVNALIKGERRATQLYSNGIKN
ncbi:hypothetical protein OVA10_23345 [Lelliottia sp. SL45]|nr:hypothetical protein [Lelliottia sp. SL45]MCY1700952.1 hypothetical protein [Lelliottia sp. SL45]